MRCSLYSNTTLVNCNRKIGVVILVLCFLVIRQEFDPEREEWR